MSKPSTRLLQVIAGSMLEFMPYPKQLNGLRGKDRKHFHRKMTQFFDSTLERDG